ncbi:General amino-acid permease GAP1 [Botrytis cinerea]
MEEPKYDSEKGNPPLTTTHTGSREAYMADTKAPWSTRFVDSFKRDPNAAVTKPSQRGLDGLESNVSGFDHRAAAEATANSGLARELKPRHLQMIAIGGSIGTGLFVTSGAALSSGGPASLIIAYGIIGIMLFCTVHALGEMAVVSLSLDPSLLTLHDSSTLRGVCNGMELCYSMACRLTSGNLIVAINFFGVKGYGEAEFIFSIIKIAAVIGFIILGIVLNTGGQVGGGEYIGARYWYPNTVPSTYAGYDDPSNQNADGTPMQIVSGAFNNGFKGLCSVFVTAAFSFAGTELVGLAAAETANPRKTLPTAIKQVFWRICLFYMVALTLVSVLVPYGDQRLLGSSSTDAKASPFVIAINNARIGVLPSIMNVVILISVLSVGNSSIYGSSRTLAALAEQGQAPKFLAYIDRKGRPLFSIIFSSVIGLLCYVVAGGPNTAALALNWLYSLSGLSSLFTWGSICLAHIRFRAAWKAQGHTLDELAFTSQVGIIGSWIGFILNCLVLIAQFWTAIWPIGYASMSSTDIAKSFFLAYLAAPVVLAFYIPYKLWYKTPFMKAKDMDLDTGKRDLDTPALIEQDRLEKASWPAWKRAYKTMC